MDLETDKKGLSFSYFYYVLIAAGSDVSLERMYGKFHEDLLLHFFFRASLISKAGGSSSMMRHENQCRGK